MKNKQFILILLAFLTVAIACKKTETESPVRLFRPVISGTLIADSNAIFAAWQKIKGSTSYTIQVSRDTFRTVDVSLTVKDTGSVLAKNLKWDQLYQVQIKANASDTALSSKWSSLGAIKTPRFPTILNSPSISDITENAVRVSWVASGATVTSVRILKASDSSIVTTATLTGTDVTNQYKIVTGLSPATPYIIFLYSGATVRGWANFSTKAPFSGNVIDLRGITGRPSVLSDTLPLIASGSTVLLKRGETYTIAAAVNLSKTVVITSGSDLSIVAQPIISMPANFNITAGSSIDSIVFNDVTLRGTDYTAKYVFNINTACTIGKMSFTSCKAEIFRGMIRTQTSTAAIGNLFIDNCILDSLSGYGVITVDVATSKVDNITIRNSTMYKVEKIITSRSNSNTITMENCTVNEAPLGGGGNYYIDYTAALNVTNGIIIKNSIFGVGKTAATLTVRGVRVGTTTTVTADNNYKTSDQVSLGNDIPNIIPYARPSTQLWQDPLNGNFKIVDALYTAKATTGDPRWR